MKDYLNPIYKSKETIVKVLQRDIDDGFKKKCYDCAIAYAIMRDGNYSYRTVSVAETIRIQHWDYVLSKGLINWINNYDSGVKVKPITIKITYNRLPIRGYVEIVE